MVDNTTVGAGVCVFVAVALGFTVLMIDTGELVKVTVAPGGWFTLAVEVDRNKKILGIAHEPPQNKMIMMPTMDEIVRNAIRGIDVCLR